MKLKSVILSVVLASSFVTVANANFMKDFYSSAGTYQGNVTSAGIYQSNSMNTVTGGGFVYRAPRKDFSAFYFTPPSLSAGCGGIDIFLGAFGIPSREEFVAFLRNIGTALPGLAFQLALQTLAPDLNEQVTSFRDLIRKYTNMFSDSCTAAQNLLKMTGAEEWIQKSAYEARSYLRSMGIVSDESEANAKTRTSGSTVLSNEQTKKDSGGSIVDAAELNLTWALLSGGTFATSYNRELRELMMTLVGTVIYVNEGSGDNMVSRAIPIAGQDLVGFMFGRTDSEVLETEAFRLKCESDDEDKCLTVSKTSLEDVNLPYQFMQAATHYRLSILQRDPSIVSEDEMLLLASSTTIPLLRLISATTTKRYLGFSQDLLSVYVEAAAYEAIIRALDRLALDLKVAASSSSATQTGKIAASHMAQIEGRIKEVREDLSRRSDSVFQQMSRAHSFVTQIEHLERSVKGALSADLAANLAFGDVK
ncbi:MAG: conjugal transfer protein TraH [Burkholderiales bacterium]|nr:conjugal transfer protein TraH [Burkholderiales bacterium]